MQGVRLPNHGQDFVPFTVRLNTGRFGVDKADRISLTPAFESSAILGARRFEAASLP
jgi:hypothetical protein